MAVREHECHCREHAHFAVLVHQGERVSKACEGNLLKHTTDSALHTDALHTFTSVAFRRGCHHKEMVMGVPEGPWASYCMLDDNFEDPTTAELCQAHIRTDLVALHPCRGQWVRDAKGRLGVLAADKDWRNDPFPYRINKKTQTRTSVTEISWRRENCLNELGFATGYLQRAVKIAASPNVCALQSCDRTLAELHMCICVMNAREQ